jgi:hypothetical protein
MRPTFKHKPLSTKTDEIRLIRILPGSDPEELHCDLIHVSMDENPHYNALSYAWREPAVFSPKELSSTEILFVHSDKQRRSGKTTSRVCLLKIFIPCLKIGKNLAAFLRSYRSPETPSDFIWVDAICINQKDLKERGLYVQRMRDIYKNAREVLAWLGPQALDTALAYEHIRMLYLNCQVGGGDSVTSSAHEDSRTWSEDEIICVKDGLKTGNHTLGWKAFFNLLDRSWWDRVWVAQEVVAATNIKVICGPCKLEWPILGSLLENISKNWGWLQDMGMRSELCSQFKVPHGVHTAVELKNLRQWNGHLDFLRVLYRTRTKSCSDMRDKVYGVLGLATDAEAIIPFPDYSLSTIDVYKALSVSMIETRGDLDCLLLAGNLPLEEQRNMSLPSWCPDLSRCRRMISMNSPFEGFHAAGHSRPITKFKVQLGVLKLEGFCLDIIDGLGVKLSSCGDFSKAIIQPRLQRSSYGTDEDTYHAIWKTSVARRTLELAEKDLLMPNAFAGLFARQCCYLEGFYQENNIPSSPSNPGAVKVESFNPHESRAFHHWYFQNRSMSIGGKTLQSWAETFDCGPNGNRGIVQPTQHELWIMFEGSFMLSNYDRKIVTTEKGYFGMAPEQTRRGDVMCILLGGRLPVILRPVDQHWEFMGECYIHGVMNGEAMGDLENGLYKLQSFELH